jgi:hypothetical protein
MELANSCQDDFMEAESCLNLSKAYEKLADFSAAIHFGRMCLKHSNMDPRTPGYAFLGGSESIAYREDIACVFLVIALSQLGLSQFQGSLRSFERAMAISNRTKDKLLELQVCIGLSLLFTLLR